MENKIARSMKTVSITPRSRIAAPGRTVNQMLLQQPGKGWKSEGKQGHCDVFYADTVDKEPFTMSTVFSGLSSHTCIRGGKQVYELTEKIYVRARCLSWRHLGIPWDTGPAGHPVGFFLADRCSRLPVARPLETFSQKVRL